MNVRYKEPAGFRYYTKERPEDFLQVVTEKIPDWAHNKKQDGSRNDPSCFCVRFSFPDISVVNADVLLVEDRVDAGGFLLLVVLEGC